MSQTVTLNFDMISEIKTNKYNKNLYYANYAISFHIIADGIGNALVGNLNKNIKYTNIYGKTIRELIFEGRVLMQEFNMTLEKYIENSNKSNE